VLVSINIKENTLIEKDTLIFEVETTKASFDIYAPFSGYVYFKASLNDVLKVDAPIALISDLKVNKDDLFINYFSNENKSKTELGITKKAEILINKLKLSSSEISISYPNEIITEKIVKDFAEQKNDKLKRLGFEGIERVGIIGGVSGGGALILIDSIINSGKQIVVAVFDSSPEFENKKILGVPVVGSHDLIEEWFKLKRLDSIVIAFNKNLNERENVFNKFNSIGIPFTNIIDSKCDIRSAVELGKGNVILGQSYIGPASKIGDNNFISSNVCLEHGNILGSHCAFGPGVFTSGNVQIGSKVRFATGIHVEPNIKIGDDVVISSGATIINHISSGTVIKNK
jgi:acetyltransferase-like isoleucine patch superfamily enzyme